MPDTPEVAQAREKQEAEARERLADLIEDRRLHLRMTLLEVAKTGRISYEVLRNLRNGTGSVRRMRPLTKRGIEDGLQWTHGSVDEILAGREPTTMEIARAAAHKDPVEQAIWDHPDLDKTVKQGMVAILRSALRQNGGEQRDTG